MPIIEMPMYKQVSALLKNKRKERLYNVQDTIAIELPEVDMEQSEIAGFSMQNQFDADGHSVHKVTPYFSLDGNLYVAERYIVPRLYGAEEKASEKVLDFVSDIRSRLGFENYELYNAGVTNTLDDIQGCQRLCEWTKDQKCEDANEDDIKQYYSDNEEHAKKKMMDKFNLWVVDNGKIYRKVSDPLLSMKLKDSSYNYASIPVYLADAFPIRSNGFQYYDMSKMDKKEEYGKSLFDISFGEGLYNNIRNNQSSSFNHNVVDEKLYLNDMCDRLKEKGEELKEAIQRCRDSHYDLGVVLDTCSLVHDLSERKKIGKKNTRFHQPDSEAYVRMASDFSLMEIASLVGAKRGDIERSYYASPEDKKNIILSDGQKFKESELVSTPLSFNM